MTRRVFYTVLLLVALLVVNCNKKRFWQPQIKYQNVTENQSVLNFDELSKTNEFLIVNFFAPDCPPCIEELPELDKIYQLTNSGHWKSVKLIAFGSYLPALDDPDISDSEIKEAVIKFNKRHNIEYPVHLATAKDLKKWGITGFPETFILTRNSSAKEFKWILRRKFISVINTKEISEYIKTSSLDTTEAAKYPSRSEY